MTTIRRFKLSAWLSLIGIILSIFSVYHHVEVAGGYTRGPSFCSINKSFDCDLVVKSAYSQFFGLPLGVWGLVFYFSFLLLSFGWEERQELRRDVAFLLSFLATAVSVVLFIISKIYVGAFCLICMTMYVVNFLLFAVHLRGDPIQSIGRGLYTVLIRYPATLFDNGVQGKKALKNFILLGVVFCLSVLLPTALQSMFERTSIPTSHFINLWNSSPPQEIKNSSSGPNRDYSKGSGKVEIVEFADLECPACRKFYPAMEKIIEDYKDKISFTFRNYPLDKSCNPALPESFHKSACFAAYFTRCAGEQDKFWEALHFVMTLPFFDGPRNKDEEAKEQILAGSASLGLDEEAIKECVGAERTKKKIMEDVKEGDRLGLQGTPSVWINGKRVDDPEGRIVKEILDHLLR